MNVRMIPPFAAALVALPLASYATPITPTADSQGVVAFYNSSTNNQVGSAACFNFSSVGNTVGCSGSATTPTTGATLNYLTTATSSYGVLKAAGQSSISGASGISNTTDYSSSNGQAYFEDSWIITGGSGTGTLGLQFALDGSYNFCYGGLTLGFGLVNLDNFSNSSGTPALSGCSGSISKNVTLTTGFTFGTPVDFLVSLTAGSTLFDLGKNESSNIDFSNTALMNAIIVKDSNGNVVPFDLSTGSGAALFSQLAPGIPTSSVPEPLSLSLFGAGFAGIIAMRRWRKAKA